ncbi:protein translocase subunit SecF [Nocardioides sp.]|uniref:protein translocase subunit SecF n=1 Tax=Nocardioides sp. TaxID=35761 RepID=UPI0035281CD8
MSRFSRWGGDLYSGRRSIEFVGRRWLWYAISGVIVLVAAVGLQVKPLDFGIEFVGGAQFKVSLPSDQVTQDNADKLREAVAATGIDNAKAPVVSTSGQEAIDVQTQPLTSAESQQVVEAIASTVGVDAKTDINQSEVGPSWGKTVAKRSLIGLTVFLVLVALFIALYFREWKMSVAALVALAHDLVITIGVYAWSGFEVTPATVTGLLTILGFSLYDTVVVFDKVRENTKNLRKTHMTYAEASNLAVNQTLVRSINTSLVALLPVAAILYVGVVQLGSGSLKDLSLALFVGMAAGTYSSIFVATPLLVHLKSMEKPIQEADRRAKARKKHQADRYASVPAFAEDMPIYTDPDASGARLAGSVEVLDGDPTDDPTDDLDDDLDADADERPTRSQPAMGKGRVTPTPRGEVRRSGSAGRAQPARESRAKRGKK